MIVRHQLEAASRISCLYLFSWCRTSLHLYC